jgi:hypothetical protein
MATHSIPSLRIRRISPVTPKLGRAIAQAVSRSLPTAAARVRARGRSRGICAGQRGIGGRFSQSASVSPVNMHSTDCSMIIIIYNQGLVQ